MRYLTEIRDADGRSLPFVFDEIENIGKYSFDAFDAETQKTVNVDTMSNCLGITTFKLEEIEYVVAAVHNKNAAKLYRFVEFIDTQLISTPSYVHDDSDKCFELDRDRNMFSNTPTLTVEFINSMITRVLGECGSVVIRMGYNSWMHIVYRSRAYTLYDFLLDLCRLCMLNVMSYETIRLVDTNIPAIMTIKLVHNSEADRFFTEMYVRARGRSFMRYVSDIRIDGKPADYAAWPYISNVVVTTKDMVTGVTEEVSDFPIDDCYGFSPRRYNGDCFIARHTAQAAQLYKYIKLVKTYSNIPERSSDADFCSLGSRANFDTPQDAATRTLVIDSYFEAVEFCEPCGSVVNRGDEDISMYSSLYDFLIFLCKSTGLNIMSYRTVLFCNRYYDCNDTELIFDHGAEANRFFFKMYMMGVLGKSS